MNYERAQQCAALFEGVDAIHPAAETNLLMSCDMLGDKRKMLLHTDENRHRYRKQVLWPCWVSLRLLEGSASTGALANTDIVKID